MLAQDVPALRPHDQSIMIGTGKGGVGKSTVATHLAAKSAADGARTLLVCVTSQEDDDLGIRTGRGIHPDGPPVIDGEGLYRAIHDRAPLVPVREVRQNLDVVPGGTAVGQIPGILMMRMMQDGPAVVQSLAQALEPISGWYDRIVFDSAPEQDTLEQLTVAASRWLAIPTRSDVSSINGLRRIATNFKLVRQQVNPYVEVAGAFLYASNPSATRLHDQVRKQMLEILGASTPTLVKIVGYREKPAVLARARGLLFWEYAALLGDSAKSYDVAAGRAKASIVPLAKDMSDLVQEILEHCGKAGT